MRTLLSIAITIAALPVFSALSQTLERQIVTSSQFAREILSMETAAEWRAKLGVTVDGQVPGAVGTDTNAIPNLNGSGTNTTLYNATVVGLDLNGGTDLLEVYNTTSAPPVFVIKTNGVMHGNAGGLTNLTYDGWTLNVFGAGFGTNAGRVINLTNISVVAGDNITINQSNGVATISAPSPAAYDINESGPKTLVANTETNVWTLTIGTNELVAFEVMVTARATGYSGYLSVRDVWRRDGPANMVRATNLAGEMNLEYGATEGLTTFVYNHNTNNNTVFVTALAPDLTTNVLVKAKGHVVRNPGP